jgi:hypothetical protein
VRDERVRFRVVRQRVPVSAILYIYQIHDTYIMHRYLIIFYMIHIWKRPVTGYWTISFSAVPPATEVLRARQRKKWNDCNSGFASRSRGIAKGNSHNVFPRSMFLPLSMSPADTLDQQSTPVVTISRNTASLLSELIVQGDDETFTLSPQMAVIVFIIGVIPFVIATFEFWRRIAVGAPFGTGSDSVVFPLTNVTIGMDDVSPLSSRGKQVLGTDSLVTAYLIFATVGVVLGIVFYAILTSPIPS